MKRKLLLVTLILAALTGTAYSYDYSHDMKLHLGESTEIDNYIVAYERESSNNNKMLSVGQWTDTSFLVMEKLEGTEIYDAEGELLDISENLTLGIESIGNDRDGQFIELNMSSNQDIFSSGEMTSSAPSKIIVSQGESTDVSLTINNDGYLNQTYSLGSESDNSSVTTSFNFQDFNVTEVYVPAGGEETVTAELSVPDTAELGTYDVKLFARNGTELSENVQVEIRGAEVERDLSLEIDQSYTRSQPGEEVEIPFRVINGISGGLIRDNPQGVALNDIEFDITVPEGWDYELRPETISTLEMRDRRQVMLTVDVPEDAQPGDFFVDVSASSEETSMEEPDQVRVNIHEESGMSTVGLVLMFISLGMLVFVYRKFGRR